MTTRLDHLPFTRRRLLHTSALALAASQMPFWSIATHAQQTEDAFLVAGNNEFALHLYDALRQDTDGNLLVSPYSISLALAMVYLGAEGDTATQMAEVLGFDHDPADLATAFRDLSDDMVERGNAEADDDQGQAARGLSIANALWGEASFPFSTAYMDTLSDDFGAGLELVEFSEDPDAARDEINDWVADHTNDRIEDIVPEGAITTDTRLVLANAIWFSGAWQSAFDADRTEDGDFTLLDDDTVSVSFMRQTESYPYAAGEGFQAIELPYDGSGFAFTVLLPDEGEFEAFEESLDQTALDAILADLQRVDVALQLPRFTFDYDANLTDTLQALGMTDAFDGTQADFSGMVDGKADPLAISSVLHKAFIDLNEDGTEAAAATVVMMEATSAQEEVEPIELVVDRPFIFAIRDTDTGTILFLGRVLDPGNQ